MHYYHFPLFSLFLGEIQESFLELQSLEKYSIGGQLSKQAALIQGILF